jgi:predicted nuclease with TOPRIM domain
MPKSDEQYQSEIDDLKAKIDGLVDSKNTILDEKKKLEKKYKEFDSDEYFKLRDDFDKLEGEHKKLEKANGLLSKDFEKANATIAEKDGNLSKLLIDDGIAKSLNGLDKHKLNDGALELATMAIKSKGVELVDGVAMIGDKSLNDYITTDWLADGASKNLLTPNENSGGGANGGNSNGGQNIDRKNMTPDQLMNAGRDVKQ